MICEAHAKVNLTLEVLGRRADGYHAIRSLLVPVSLSDTLEFEDSGGITTDTGYADDLVAKAAEVLRDTAGIRAGMHCRIRKRIPAGGGLGGGSADAAAALVALNDRWGLGFSLDRLVALAALVGSDVPALVHGGAVLMEGRGELVSPLRLPGDASFPRLYFVLANPHVHCPTAEVFAHCTPRVTNDLSIVYNMQNALASGDPSRIASALVNDLQAPACRLYPPVAEALGLLSEAGAIGAAVSGSGSTVFGLVPDEAQGRKIAALLNAQGLSAWSVHTIVP